LQNPASSLTKIRCGPYEIWGQGISVNCPRKNRRRLQDSPDLETQPEEPVRHSVAAGPVTPKDGWRGAERRLDAVFAHPPTCGYILLALD